MKKDVIEPATNDEAVCAVSVQGVSKRYKNRLVLNDISFSCRPGQSIAVIGFNGAGKTTLLRALLGFVGFDWGRIELFGIDATQPVARKRVAFLPERLMLNPDLSGWQSLQLLLGVRAINPERARCERDLAALGFPIDQFDSPAKVYSKGMAQKIGLAAAINCDARLAILDEPLSGLDPRARRAMTKTLINWRRADRSLLFTAHSLTGLDLLCDKVAVMHQGRLAFFDEPVQLVNQFTDRESAVDLAEDSLEQAFLNCIEEIEEFA